MEQLRRQLTESTDVRPAIQRRLQSFQGAIQILSAPLTGILVLLISYSLYLARDFFLPVTLAVLLSLLLAPVVGALTRLHMSNAVSAAIVIVMIVGIATFGAYRLAGPAAEWIDRAPLNIRRAQSKLQSLLRPVEEMQETTRQIEELATLGKGKKAPTVEIKRPGLDEIVLVQSQRFFVWGGLSLILLYFLLASGDLFLVKLVKVLPTLEEKKCAVRICRRIESDISTYLSTVTLVNIGLGVIVGITMFLLGMPNPALWGVMAALLNYVPYLGALAGILIVTMVAILSFDNLTLILLVPSLYFVFNVLEAYVITPTFVGRKLALNPVVVFLWLIFLAWSLGVIGALLAVPLLAIFKIICDHCKPLGALGVFLSAEP